MGNERAFVETLSGMLQSACQEQEGCDFESHRITYHMYLRSMKYAYMCQCHVKVKKRLSMVRQWAKIPMFKSI